MPPICSPLLAGPGPWAPSCPFPSSWLIHHIGKRNFSTSLPLPPLLTFLILRTLSSMYLPQRPSFLSSSSAPFLFCIFLNATYSILKYLPAFTVVIVLHSTVRLPPHLLQGIGHWLGCASLSVRWPPLWGMPDLNLGPLPPHSGALYELSLISPN